MKEQLINHRSSLQHNLEFEQMQSLDEHFRTRKQWDKSLQTTEHFYKRFKVDKLYGVFFNSPTCTSLKTINVSLCSSFIIKLNRLGL